MQASLERLDGLKRKLTIQFPWEMVITKEAEEFKNLQDTAELKGFRKGKVPATLLKKRYGKAIRHDAIMNLMEESLKEAFKKEDLHVVGSPHVDFPQKIDEEKPVVFEASFEVYPDITLVELDNVEIKKASVNITDEDIKATLEKLREQRKKWKEVSRAAKKGDEVNINFVGRIDGEEFKHGSAKDVRLVLGSGQMIPGFEDGIIGFKAGDEKPIKVNFPKEYQAKELAGKEAEFTITVNKVSEAELPEINEEFAKSFDIPDGSIEGLKDELRQSMTREVNMVLKGRTKKAVFDKILELNSVEIPNVMLDEEIHHRINRMKEENKRRGLPEDAALNMKADIETQARKDLTLHLLLWELFHKHDIKPNADRVREMIIEQASAYGDPHSFIDLYYSNKQLLQQVEAMVKEEMAVEKLLEKAKVVEEALTYDELFKAGH